MYDNHQAFHHEEDYLYLDNNIHHFEEIKPLLHQPDFKYFLQDI
ncbi:MAG: hypothetical protein WCG25_08455 [bacterium]